MISGAGGFAYMDFISNLAPVVIICVLASLITFRLLFADKASEKNSKIEEKAKTRKDIFEKDPFDKVKDWNLLKKGLFVLALVVGLFVVHHELGLMPASVALIGAAFLLLITRPEMERRVSRVKWTTLLFFAGLFVIVYGIGPRGTGLLEEVASGVMNVTSGSIILSVLLILFITALGSALIDNIPFTAAMVPIVSAMSTQLELGSGILWWALAFGAGFGGNGT